MKNFYFWPKALCLFIFLLLGQNTYSQFEIQSQWGNLTDCDTMSNEIFLVWWDKSTNYDQYASEILDSMTAHRRYCLDSMAMLEPYNPLAGFYYNIYLHAPGDIFPEEWGNGQGTDNNGFPYLTFTQGGFLNHNIVSHETFHVFQYNANSPGFVYTGDSQWYIESSANWYVAKRYNDNIGHHAFAAAEGIVKAPQIPLFLSASNFPSHYPANWQRTAHQYMMCLFLWYLTEEEDVDRYMINSGLIAGTNELPQEYYFNQLGGDEFRQMYNNFAARITNDFDFLTPAQKVRNEIEWNTYGDKDDDNEFIEFYANEGTDGWISPNEEQAPGAWSFNTYSFLNTEAASYTFQLSGLPSGSTGGDAFFDAILVVRNQESGVSFYDFDMDSHLQGSFTYDAKPNDLSMKLVITSMPEVFTDVSQIFLYELKVDRDPIISSLAVTLQENKKVVARFNILGQPVDPNFLGLQILVFEDGTSKIVFKTD